MILGGGNRKISETSTKKEVIYKEVNGEKVPITQSTIKPKIEGAIVTATGARKQRSKTKNNSSGRSSNRSCYTQNTGV